MKLFLYGLGGVLVMTVSVGLFFKLKRYVDKQNSILDESFDQHSDKNNLY